MRRKILLSLLAFNGLTALIGGLGLIFGSIHPPQAWLHGTVFDTYMVPGWLLSLVVGGSALLALILTGFRQRAGHMIAFASGIIMWCWIIGEVALIEQYSPLQAVYIFTGALVMWFSYMEQIGAPDNLHVSSRRHRQQHS